MDDLKEIIKNYLMARIYALRKAEMGGRENAQEKNTLIQLEQQIRACGYDPNAILQNFLNGKPFPIPREENDNDIDSTGAPNKKRNLGSIDESEIEIKPLEILDSGTILEKETLEETEKGLRIHRQKPLILSSTGKVLKEIGGKCDEVGCRRGGFAEEISLCTNCRKALCPVHTYLFENPITGEKLPYCRRCFEYMYLHQNTWEILFIKIQKKEIK